MKKKAPDEKYIRQNISMEPEQLKRLDEFCQREETSGVRMYADITPIGIEHTVERHLKKKLYQSALYLIAG